MSWHFSGWYHLRQLLKLQFLLINTKAFVWDDCVWINGTPLLILQCNAVASSRQCCTAKSGPNRPLLLLATVAALQTELGGFGLGWRCADHNPLEFDQLGDLSMEQVDIKQPFSHNEQ